MYRKQQPRLRALSAPFVRPSHRVNPPPANQRRGITLIEMVATFVLIGSAISLAAPLLVSVSRQRLAIEQRQFAIQHAGNILESYSALPWEKLPVGTLPLADAPADVQTLLQDLKQSLEITEHADKPTSRRLSVSISWRGPSAMVAKPVQMSAWVFQAEEK